MKHEMNLNSRDSCLKSMKFGHFNCSNSFLNKCFLALIGLVTLMLFVLTSINLNHIRSIYSTHLRVTKKSSEITTTSVSIDFDEPELNNDDKLRDFLNVHETSLNYAANIDRVNNHEMNNTLNTVVFNQDIDIGYANRVRLFYNKFWIFFSG
jgi:hypothetical protein